MALRGLLRRGICFNKNPHICGVRRKLRGRGHDINICLNRNLKIMVEHFFFLFQLEISCQITNFPRAGRTSTGSPGSGRRCRCPRTAMERQWVNGIWRRSLPFDGFSSVTQQRRNLRVRPFMPKFSAPPFCRMQKSKLWPGAAPHSMKCDGGGGDGDGAAAFIAIFSWVTQENDCPDRFRRCYGNRVRPAKSIFMASR